jgi:hypothetical protein
MVSDDRSSKTPTSRNSTFVNFLSAVIALKTSPFGRRVMAMLAASGATFKRVSTAGRR